jgi:chromosomal replication initiator protein
VIPKHTAVMAICERAAMLYGCTAEDILGRSRSRTICEARKVAMHAARQKLHWSYPELARAFEREHTTLIAAVESIEEMRLRVPHVANAVRVLGLSEADA